MTPRSCVALAVSALFVGCDYDGFDLYPVPGEVPGIVDLGEIVPAVVTNQIEIDAAVMYGEVGATGTSERGGVTFSFEGNGNSACVWVDPELLFWNQSVSVLQPNQTYAYPDNVDDDGDLDLYAGFSVYYSGSPGERIGDFQIRYEDALGNQVPIDFNECTQVGVDGELGAHGGRGAPEFCTLSATQPGVSYTVLMNTWNTPNDDDRLAYGLLVVEGTCRQLESMSDFGKECMIRGEALNVETGEAWDGSEEFELAFCDAVENESNTLFDACVEEAEVKDCKTEHCFCGNPDLGPTVE